MKTLALRRVFLPRYILFLKLARITYGVSLLFSGTFDLFRCSGVPMIASLPHFYKAEQLLDGVASGLHPNKHDHGIEILLENVGLLGLINLFRLRSFSVGI